MAASIAISAATKLCRIDGFVCLKALYNIRNDIFIQKRQFYLGAIALKPRKRYDWRRDRKPANTQLAVDGEEVLEKRRTYGGGSKVKAVFKNKGSYVLKSKDIELEVPILDVIHSGSNKNHPAKKIMTKGTIVKLDATEFKNRLDVETSKTVEKENDKKMELTKLHNEEGSLALQVDENFKELIESGNLFGKVTTRPGQTGLCDGYILEGPELQQLMEKLSLSS